MRKFVACLTTICLLVSCTGCSTGKAAPEQDPSTPVKVIVDCDMGYMNDDAVALLFLLQADKLGYIDLAGICVSGGNQPGAVAANATLLLLEETQRTDIPVYIGTDEPLMGFNAERANRDYAGEVYASLAKETYVTPDHYHDLGDLYRETWGYSIVSTLVKHQSTIYSNKKLWDLVVPVVLLRPDLIVDSQVTEISVDTDENSYGVMHVGEGSASVTIVSKVSGEQIYAWFQSFFRSDTDVTLTQ